MTDTIREVKKLHRHGWEIRLDGEWSPSNGRLVRMIRDDPSGIGRLERDLYLTPSDYEKLESPNTILAKFEAMLKHT